MNHKYETKSQLCRISVRSLSLCLHITIAIKHFGSRANTREREVLSSFLNLWRGENHTKFREISLEKVPENFYSPVLGKPGKRTVNDFRISKGTSFPCESSGLTGCFGHSQNRYPHERRGARYHQNVMHVPSSSPHAIPSPQPDLPRGYLSRGPPAQRRTAARNAVGGGKRSQNEVITHSGPRGGHGYYPRRVRTVSRSSI